jgi:hypothetical protein
MKITVDIPDDILTILRDGGFSKIQCSNIFTTYLIGVLEDLHGDFVNEFVEWYENLSEDDVEDIKTGKKI